MQSLADTFIATMGGEKCKSRIVLPRTDEEVRKNRVRTSRDCNETVSSQSSRVRATRRFARHEVECAYEEEYITVVLHCTGAPKCRRLAVGRESRGPQFASMCVAG